MATSLPGHNDKSFNLTSMCLLSCCDDDDDDNNNDNNNIYLVSLYIKYKSFCIEIKRIWNLKCTIVPVIIGATGIVTSSLRKNLETVPGKHSIDSIQKTAVLGTSHIIRKVLQCEA